MNIPRLSHLALLAVGSILLTITSIESVVPAAAQEQCKVSVSGGTSRGQAAIHSERVCLVSGGGPSNASSGGGSSGGATAWWEREYYYMPDDLEDYIDEWSEWSAENAGELTPDEGTNPYPTGACATPDGRPGLYYVQHLRDATTGESLDVTNGCQPAEDLLGGDLTVGIPPDPPTVDELWDATPIQAAEITVNPYGRGVTGVSSWFWADDPGTVSVAASAAVDDWAVDGGAEIGSWTWKVDGASYTATHAGSFEEPAAEHLFEVKDTYEVTVSRDWAGEYTLTYEDITITVTDTMTDTASTDYDVIEVRSVLDEPQNNR